MTLILKNAQRAFHRRGMSLRVTQLDPELVVPERHDLSREGYRGLASSVILTALHDALLKETKTQNGREFKSWSGIDAMTDAQDFLRIDSPEFQFWCRVAGLDPKILLERYARKRRVIRERLRMQRRRRGEPQ